MSEYKLNKNYTYNVGQNLYSESGECYTIVDTLGRGGQGEVYKVAGPDGVFAVKWYYKDSYLSKINAAAFKKNLQTNVRNGIPTLSSGDSATQFIWPLKMMADQDGSFGYLMNLFPNGYEPLRNVILGRRKNHKTGTVDYIQWNSWFMRVTAAINIVRAFEILHSTGHSYQDINDGGFSINLENGNVFICDCDNVSPDKTNLGILGIKTFMAPEVVRGEKLPDRYTDEYSLAVILFRLFLHGHPMIGKESRIIHNSTIYSDQESDLLIYGSKPHYCLASFNNMNPIEPDTDKDIFRLSFTYPVELMDAFEKVFTQGVNDYNQRLTATEWRKLLLNVRDHIILKDNYEQFVGKRIEKALPVECRTLIYPNGRKVYCMPGKILYAYHFNEKSSDFKTPIGKIIPTSKENVIGLFNASGNSIDFTYNNNVGCCRNNERMPLLVGMQLKVNNMIIEVR